MYLAESDLEKRGFRLWRSPQCDARRTNEEGFVSFGLAANSGCQREKWGAALNAGNRPHVNFWNASRDELIRLGTYTQRGQKFQTDSKPVVFHALTVNDAGLGTDARLRRG
jgi:hypothetical protein